MLSLPALLAVEASCGGGLGLQTQRVDGLSAIGAHPIAAFIKPVERCFAGMQFLQVASRIREVGGGLVIGH